MTTILNGQSVPSAPFGESHLGRRYWIRTAVFGSILLISNASFAQTVRMVSSDRSSIASASRPTEPGEIIVQGSEQGSSLYRIPKDLRKSELQPPERSWSSRANEVDHLAWATTCSPVGPNGPSGCLAQSLKYWPFSAR